MVPVALVDSQSDYGGLVNAPSPLFQVILDSLDFFLQGGGSHDQFSSFLGILRTSQVHLLSEFRGGLEQLLHGRLRPLDFVNWTFHISCQP